MSRSPADVLKTIPREKVVNRLKTLWTYFNVEFKPRFVGIHLNAKLLRHAVESCFLDIARMKNFHGIEFADAHKRAAFTMLWITKAHPVQLETNVNMTESLLVINELFAIHAGIGHLDIDASMISPKYIKNLIYILHFRNPAPEILASSMYTLECAVLGKKP